MKPYIKISLDSSAEVTAPGQEQYAEYASGVINDNIDGANAWVEKILKGNNTQKKSSEQHKMIYCIVKNFKTKKQSVTFMDFTKPEFDINITQAVSSGKSIKLLNVKGDVVLSVTWKNICQGGSNPCFAIFTGDAFTGL